MLCANTVLSRFAVQTSHHTLRLIHFIVEQCRLVILATVEDSEDVNAVGIYIEGHDDTPSIVGNAYAGPDVIALDATEGKSTQAV